MSAIDEIKRAVSWWLRIGAKVVLSRLPLPYRFWKSIGLFEHGDMNKPGRTLDTFIAHARGAGLLTGNAGLSRFKTKDNELAIMELGPGDSLFTAMIDLLQEKGYAPRSIDSVGSLDDLLEIFDACYLTKGVESIGEIPSESLDFCFSNAVLEHINTSEFPKLANELRRVLKPNGVSAHRVDLKDHLGGGLDNLRFSEAIWKGALFRSSGFHTNRIRFAEMIQSLEAAGLDCEVTRLHRWDKLPIERGLLAKPFRYLPDEDLRVRGFDLLLRRQRL